MELNAKKNVILHISNTDIRFDSRILKELEAVESLLNFRIVAFGLMDSEESRTFVDGSKVEIYVNKSIFSKFKIIPRPLRYALVFFESFLKILIKGIRLKPKIVHCHDTLFLPIALLIKIICGSRLIYDAHELESNKAGQSFVLSKATLFLEKIAWQYINLLISVSPSIIKWYQKEFSEKDSLLILNSPKLHERGQKDSSRANYLSEKFEIPSNCKIFLYLGIISKGRGIEIYLDVFSQREVQSHIVFMGYGDYVTDVKKFEEKFSNIHYHPPVSHQEIVPISKSADVGLCMIENVSLSDYYCLPNKLFEYAFSGLFILASDFPDIKEIINDYSLGLCTSGERESLLNSIKKIENEDLKLNAKNLDELSWEYQAEKLLKTYKQYLGII